MFGFRKIWEMVNIYYAYSQKELEFATFKTTVISPCLSKINELLKTYM